MAADIEPRTRADVDHVESRTGVVAGLVHDPEFLRTEQNNRAGRDKPDRLAITDGVQPARIRSNGDGDDRDGPSHTCDCERNATREMEQ
jgi:hypothetical protein